MSDEPQGIDPYAVVLADLRAQRDKIDAAIAAIESLRGISAGVGTVAGASTATAQGGIGGSDGPSAFLGMTIPEATKKLLVARRTPLRNPDIAVALKAGGLILQSKEPANTIGSVLTRRAAEVGDIVKVGRGTWGLREWVRGNARPKDKAGEKGTDDSSGGPSGPEQPVTPPLNDLLS